MKKKIFYGLVIVFLALQFFRPEKNLSDDRTYDISARYRVPERINAIWKVACNDCHTNKTNYPWYTEIQPIGLWLNHHVTDGKRHLNFSSFTQFPIAVQNHRFEDMIKTIKEGEMPLPAYTWLGLHADANLSDQDKSEIINWARHQMDSLKNHYPPDSLVMKRRRGQPL